MSAGLCTTGHNVATVARGPDGRYGICKGTAINLLPFDISRAVEFQDPGVAVVIHKRFGAPGDDVPSVASNLNGRPTFFASPAVGLLPLDVARPIQLQDPEVVVRIPKGSRVAYHDVASIGRRLNIEGLFVLRAAVGLLPLDVALSIQFQDPNIHSAGTKGGRVSGNDIPTVGRGPNYVSPLPHRAAIGFLPLDGALPVQFENP